MSHMNPDAPELKTEIKPATIVMAGAGTGKTHHITQRVVQLVKQGVPIDRIGAVTFTEAATAELQERIRAALLDAQLFDAARRVDAAPIRTIHALALSLLKENPVEARLSPEPQVLSELESKVLMGTATADVLDDDAQCARVERLTGTYYKDLLRPPFTTAADFLRDDLRTLCDHLRALRLTSSDQARTISANLLELRSVFGTPGDRAALDSRLRDAMGPARQYLTLYPNGKTKGDSNVVEKLRKLVQHIEGGSITPEGLADGVTKWSAAGKDFLGVAQPLSASVDHWLRHHPASLERLEQISEDLTTVAFAALIQYQALKSHIGALDFEDMQARALDMLETEVEGVAFADYVAAGMSHLIVDEFQDTSPLQFRIAETLRAHGTETVYVGDPRQGIYGFRGADSRLLMALEEVQRRAGTPSETLARNWRSRPELVDVVNGIFDGLFPKVGLSYVRVSPAAKYGTLEAPTIPKSVPCIDIVPPGRGSENILLGRLEEILSDPNFRVYDRQLERERRVRPGDIAIIGATNLGLDGWAARLKAIGRRFTRELGGWSTTLEVQLVQAAMVTLINPSSSLEVATLLTSEVYGISQHDLKRLKDGGFFERPRYLTGSKPEEATTFIAECSLSPEGVGALWRYREDYNTLFRELQYRTLPDFLQALIERLQLEVIFVTKPNGAQARANLLRLVEHARAFLDLKERGLEMVGATAFTVENFLFYLRTVVAETADGQPESVPEDDGAIRLITMHGAKGLEWPIVVLPDLQRAIGARLPRLEIVRPERPEDLVGPELFRLSRLRVFPDALGDTLTQDLAEGLGGRENARAEAARLLYVALTRAREHLILSWAGEPKPETQQALLEESGIALSADGKSLRLGDRRWPVRVCAHDAPTQMEVSDPIDRAELRQFFLEGTPLSVPDDTIVTFVEPPELPLSLQTSPTELCHLADSQEEWRKWRRNLEVQYPVSGREAAVELQALASGPLNRFGIKLEPTRLGKVVHLALELADLGGGGRSDDALRTELAAHLAKEKDCAGIVAYCLGAVVNVRALVTQLDAEEVLREVPFVLPVGRHRMTGVIDLAIRTAKGWHVFDHKVHAIEAGQIPKWAAFYAPQLEAYALALTALRPEPVVGRHLLFHTVGVGGHTR